MDGGSEWYPSKCAYSTALVGGSLFHFFFWKPSLYPFLTNSSASWVSGTFKEGAIGCLLAHCIAHPCGTPALVAEGRGDMAAHTVPHRHTLPCCVTVCSLSKRVPHLLLTMATACFGAVTLGGDQEDSHPISLASSIPSSRMMTDYVVSA